MSTATTSALWIGEACMGLGALAFWFMALRARSEDRHHYLTSLLVVLIALSSYLAMATGQTRMLFSDGHELFVARYLDWLFTTPLLLLGLAAIGIRSYTVNKTLVYGAIGADVIMIVTGLAGGMAVDNSRWLWYAYSCVAFIAVLAILWGPLRAEAAVQQREAPYRQLLIILTVLWIQYPIVWLLGDEGLRMLGIVTETTWFMILDVLAKVGFGFASLAAVAKLASASTKA